MHFIQASCSLLCNLFLFADFLGRGSASFSGQLVALFFDSSTALQLLDKDKTRQHYTILEACSMP
jgi:hypothetical protein